MRPYRIGICLVALALAGAMGCASSAKRRPAEPVAEEAAAPEPAPEVTAVVTARALNLRGGPGTNHPVTGKLAKGDRVRVLEEQGEWRRVRVGEAGAEGWASSAYLKTE